MSIGIVIKQASKRGHRISLVDERTLYIDDRPFQVIPSVWFNSGSDGHPAMTMYLPRTWFADFLLYVPRGTDNVYIIPRGLMAYDSSWSEPALRPYLHAWPLLENRTPEWFERNFVALSPPLQRVIDLAKERELNFELILTKKGMKRIQYRNVSQHRIIIENKRCLIYKATIQVKGPTELSICAIFRISHSAWAEIMIYLVEDAAVFIIPKGVITHETTMSIASSYLAEYRNNWDVFTTKTKSAETGERFGAS